jgi:hypothetical protein
MRTRTVVVFFSCLFVWLVSLNVSVQAQQNLPDTPSAKSAQTNNDDPVVEGTVVSTTRHTLVVRSDDDRYHLFTYDTGVAHSKAVQPGARVRVNGTAPDEEGTQVAENVAVLEPSAGGANPASGGAANSGAAGQAAPPPPQVGKVTNEIESEARRWHAGGRLGVGFSPEIFLFGVQSQIGPFFSPHLLFRPNAEFGFGELTDMFSLNLEASYRLNTSFHRTWTPYIGFGPSLNFIHQGASSGNVSFGNFNYKTGFNVFLGAQRRKTFLEMKTALWSGQAPVLRLMVGYNF